MTTATPSISVTSREPCPICGGEKRCLVSASGSIVRCYRESKGCLRAKLDCQGVAYWVHRGPSFVELNEDPLPVPNGEIADADNRNRVYAALLSKLGLSAEHRAALKVRGLDDYEINTRRYATVTGKPWNAAKYLRSKFDDEVLVQIPGLVVKAGKEPGTTYLSIAAPPGLLIPVRDEQGRIVALAIRPDKNDGSGKYKFLSSAKHGGPKADNRPHMPLAQRSAKPIIGLCDDVRVTEGILKSDVTTSKNCKPTLGVSGVSNWRKVIPLLQGLQAKSVSLAYDADAATKPEVAHHLLQFHAGLLAAGFDVGIETWPIEQGKGIDDLLAAGGTPDRLEGDAADEFLEKLKGIAATRRAADEPQEQPQKKITVLEADDDPHRLGRMFIDSQYRDAAGVLTLRYYMGDFHVWSCGAWRLASIAELKSNLNASIKSEFDRLNILAQQNDDGEGDEPPKAKKVTRAIVENTVLAIQSIVVLSDEFVQPCWLANSLEGYPAAELLVTKSGILHLPSVRTDRECLLPLTPNLFTPTALGYAYDQAAECPEFLAFLRTLWPDDMESVNLLQEYMGLLLTSDTQFHKLLLIIGPTRSGKGTIGRICKAMLGTVNVASPTLGSLAEQFGLACLIGKTMALVADCRLSGRADAVAIVERLLSITGEDPQDVQRKHLPTLAAIRLLARFVILANELPRLQDAAGALLSRVLLLRTTESFLGREDKGLEKRLLTELPGILNWAIAGWQRLMARGRFQQPNSGKQMIDDLEELSSPIGQFIKEHIIFPDPADTPISEMYEVWKYWCEKNGREHPGTLQTFGRDIRTALPQLETKRGEKCGVRTRLYVGIRLRTALDSHADEAESRPHTSADVSIAREAKNEQENKEHGSAEGTIGHNSSVRGRSRTEPSGDQPAESSPPAAAPLAGDNGVTTPDPGLTDPDRPRNVRLGAPKYGPWVNQPNEEGDAA